MEPKILPLFSALLFALLIVSCGPPKQYETGMNFYNLQKYDSAMYYFDRLLPDDKEWLDSAKIMKYLCLEKMISRHDWAMYNLQLDLYGRDTSLMRKSNSYLEKELLKMMRSDSLKAYYKVHDFYKNRFSSTVLASVMQTHMDEFLNNNFWKEEKNGGGKLYFERDKEGSIAKSAKTLHGWTKGIPIYKAIVYDTNGTFSMKPRIFRGHRSYFGKGGSISFQGKDSLKVNYGKALRYEKLFFIRDEKYNTVQ
jgi:hypothetical protein